MSNKFAWHGPAFGSMRAQSYGGGFVPFVVHAAGQIQSPNLEYNVVEHCNYACRECSHFSPHMPAHQADLPTFRRDLAALQAVYHVGRFRFVGGEPLLNKNLVEFVTAVRDSGIADKIEVATNGSLVHKAPDELFEAIDFFNISWYPDRRCDAAKVKLAEEKCRTHATVFKARAVSKFRLMQIDRRTADARLVKDIYDTCQLAHSWHCQTFYEGYFYLCSRPTLTARYLEQRGVEIPDLRTRDGVSLHEPRLGERLRAYLENPEPLESCHYCLGTVGSRIPWQQSSLAERRSTAPSDRLAQQAISRPLLLYLKIWAKLERAVLSVLPFPAVARGIAIAKEASVQAIEKERVFYRKGRWLAIGGAPTQLPHKMHDSHTSGSPMLTDAGWEPRKRPSIKVKRCDESTENLGPTGP